jgi:hypothetical protein
MNNATLVDHGCGLDVLRGLRGAMIGGAMGLAIAAGPPLLLDADYLLRRATNPITTVAGDYWRWASFVLIWPILGCVPIFTAAGWISHAPRQQYRFISSLGLVFAITLGIWIVVKAMGWSPMRFSEKRYPTIYFSEAVTLVTPPVVIAIVLTWVRARRRSSIIAERIENEPA